MYYNADKLYESSQLERELLVLEQLKVVAPICHIDSQALISSTPCEIYDVKYGLRQMLLVICFP
jgi:hypothetical protein